MRTSLAALLLLCFLPCHPTHGEGATNDEAVYKQINIGFKAAAEDAVTPLIVQLGSPDFVKREAASEKLRKIGPAAFSLLSHHYREIDDYEVRLRIQSIVKDQYLWHTLLKHKGFMGISYAPHTGKPLADGVSAIAVNSVQLGSAAIEAGLARRDIILTVNGQSTNDMIGDQGFAKLVQDKGAGGTIVLGIMRQGRVREVTLRLKARPIKDYISPELLGELNSRMQAYSIWWEKHFSLPRVSQERAASANVLEIPKN